MWQWKKLEGAKKIICSLNQTMPKDLCIRLKGFDTSQYNSKWAQLVPAFFDTCSIFSRTLTLPFFLGTLRMRGTRSTFLNLCATYSYYYPLSEWSLFKKYPELLIFSPPIFYFSSELAKMWEIEFVMQEIQEREGPPAVVWQRQK